MGNGWSLERRDKQAELIRLWMPWKQSTGPKSVEGEERVAANAWRGGHRQKLCELASMVNADIRQARQLIAPRRTRQLISAIAAWLVARL